MTDERIETLSDGNKKAEAMKNVSRVDGDLLSRVDLLFMPEIYLDINLMRFISEIHRKTGKNTLERHCTRYFLVYNTVQEKRRDILNLFDSENFQGLRRVFLCVSIRLYSVY